MFYRDDAITIMYIPPDAPQTTISEAMPQPSSELKVNAQPNCPESAAAVRAFKEGSAS